ncbi:MAG: type II secretion system protein [Vulcanimicrobiota bacterium]
MRRAFTLIEVMISLALLSILFSCQLELMGSSGSLRRQKELVEATRQAEKQLAQLQKTPFEQLPPQLLRPDSQGWMQLGQADLDPASLKLRALEGSSAGLKVTAVEPLKGRVQVGGDWAGHTLLVEYDCYLCDRGEIHRIGADGQIKLDNPPAARVQSILQARGEQLTPFQDWTFEPSSGLRLGPSAPGLVLMVDYRGGRRVHRLTSTFADEQLRPQRAPSNFKLLRLQEVYAGHERLTVSSLRVSP